MLDERLTSPKKLTSSPRMIAEPKILPSDGTTPLYRGEMDRLAYESIGPILLVE
jgi:hypothetical protein